MWYLSVGLLVFAAMIIFSFTALFIKFAYTIYNYMQGNDGLNIEEIPWLRKMLYVLTLNDEEEYMTFWTLGGVVIGILWLPVALIIVCFFVINIIRYKNICKKERKVFNKKDAFKYCCEICNSN